MNIERWKRVGLLTLLFGFFLVPDVFARRNVKQAKELRSLISSLDQLIVNANSSNPQSVKRLFADISTFLESATKLTDSARQELRSDMKKVVVGWTEKPLKDSASYHDLMMQFRANLLALTGKLAKPAIPPNFDRGKATFKRHCVSCHGVSGNGKGKLAERLKTKLPNWESPSSLENVSISMHYNWLLSGKGTKMPSYREVLDAHDFWSVLFYIQTLPYQSNVRSLRKAKANPSVTELIYLSNRQITSKYSGLLQEYRLDFSRKN